MTQADISLLKMNRNRVMHAASNPLPFQLPHYFIAVLHADRIDVVDMASVLSFNRRDDFFYVSKCRVVSDRMRAPQLVATIKMPQLDREACTLNRIHSAIPADHGMMIFPRLTVVAQHANLVGQFEVIRNDGTCFTKRAEVFPRIKTEAADFAQIGRASCRERGWISE